MHNNMIQQNNGRLDGGFLEHIFTKMVKFAHFTHRKSLEMVFM
jgi:hypothetical protein